MGLCWFSNENHCISLSVSIGSDFRCYVSTLEKVNCKFWGWNCKPSFPSEELPIPIVWVHDYHLMLAANTIRDICKEEGLEIRMGFFLHIPFPSFDIIRIFPWVDEILMGMLGKNEKWYYTSKIDFSNRVLTFYYLFHFDISESLFQTSRLSVQDVYANISHTVVFLLCQY